MFNKFPFFQQTDSNECGAVCAQILIAYYKKTISIQKIRSISKLEREGMSISSLSSTLEELGFKTLSVKLSFENFKEKFHLFPVIAYWDKKHYVVIYKISKNRIYISDPGIGRYKLTYEEFRKHWLKEGKEGVLICAEPTEKFNLLKEDKPVVNIWHLIHFIKRFKSYNILLLLGMLLSSLLQLVIPFTTQIVIDYGIKFNNRSLIVLILIAEFVLFISGLLIEFIRSRIMMHVGTRINVSILHSFLDKIMKLPIAYFDKKRSGDILQRVYDHNRIESFLTFTALNTIFSSLTLVTFGIILFRYNFNSFLIFVICTIIALVWIGLFQKARMKIDNRRFEIMSVNNFQLIQLIYGIQEIKLNAIQNLKMNEWIATQINSFDANLKGNLIDQAQSSGSSIINEGKNIVISFFIAYSVINGSMTVGMMVAVLYIIAQLNTPISNLLSFIHGYQDAKLSLGRIGEVYQLKNEDESELEEIKSMGDIVIKDLDFNYGDYNSKFSLKKINLRIPYGKTTAIVGASGCGKTTLMKLLLKIYQPSHGEIYLNHHNLKLISAESWRSKCGVVMQDGYIFQGTIKYNICFVENENVHLLNKAIQISNCSEFIDQLPSGLETRIGFDGINLSHGQKQRILLARALYKDPEYLLLDEATSSLDTKNEREIKENIDQLSNGKTKIIIAHRLSTVQNADQIIVMDNGEIMEYGTHSNLISMRKLYFNLIKDQLELNYG